MDFIRYMENIAVGGDPADIEGYQLARQTMEEEFIGGGIGGEPFRFRDLTPWIKTYRFIKPRPWIIPVVVGLAVIGAASLVGLGRR